MWKIAAFVTVVAMLIGSSLASASPMPSKPNPITEYGKVKPNPITEYGIARPMPGPTTYHPKGGSSKAE